MKATGIVRRIDELGRVVIPKELRRTLRIADGAALEIYTTDEQDVVFRKYSQLGALESLARCYAETLQGLLRAPAAVCDCERVVAAAGCSCVGEPVPQQVLESMKRRRVWRAEQQPLLLGRGGEVAIALPVVKNGDVEGALLLLHSPSLDEERALVVLQAAAALLAAQL